MQKIFSLQKVEMMSLIRGRSERQRIIETLLTLLSAIIPWIPIAINTIVIIAVSPSSVSKEVYISCWLCYISNPVFRICLVSEVGLSLVGITVLQCLKWHRLLYYHFSDNLLSAFIIAFELWCVLFCNLTTDIRVITGNGHQ